MRAVVGEPWGRFVVMTSYLPLVITHHSKRSSDGKDGGEAVLLSRKVSVPWLLVFMYVAAKWAGYRHLTWMIV